MKKVLIMALALMVSTKVFAFGGGGFQEGYAEREGLGVHAVGVYVDPSHPIQGITFRSCKSGEVMIGKECCPNSLIYTENDTRKCCSGGKYMDANKNCYSKLRGHASWADQGDDVYMFEWVQPEETTSAIISKGSGSWTVTYDIKTETIEVTDYYRATDGELKSIIWYAESLDDVENTPVKQGEDHALLNGLKELFGAKNAFAAKKREGTDDEYWSQFRKASDCKAHGGRCKEGTGVDDKDCECEDSCPDGQKRDRASGKCGPRCSFPKEWNSLKKACVCLNGGQEKKAGICCKGNFALKADGSYKELNARVCGCPYGEGGKEGVRIGDTCCQKGYAWNGDGYSESSEDCCDEHDPDGVAWYKRWIGRDFKYVDGFCCYDGFNSSDPYVVKTCCTAAKGTVEGSSCCKGELDLWAAAETERHSTTCCEKAGKPYVCDTRHEGFSWTALFYGVRNAVPGTSDVIAFPVTLSLKLMGKMKWRDVSIIGGFIQIGEAFDAPVGDVHCEKDWKSCCNSQNGHICKTFGGEEICVSNETNGCCPNGLVENEDKTACVCPGDDVMIEATDLNGDKGYICCNKDNVATNQGTKECCGDQKEPKGPTDAELCCAKNDAYVNGVCCPQDRQIRERDKGEVKECCPEGQIRSTDYALEGKEKYQICCVDGQKNAGGECCLESMIAYNSLNKTCCKSGKVPKGMDTSVYCCYPNQEVCWTGCVDKCDKEGESRDPETCECVCTSVEPEGGCGDKKHWDTSECACVCKNSEPEEGCGTGKSWSPSACACACDNSEPEEGCGTGKSWSPSACACTCDNSEPEEGCGTGKSWSPSDCACTCDNSEPEGGCGTGKSWSLSACACTCDNSEPEEGCGTGKSWSPSACACACDNSEPEEGCGTGKSWSPSACACTCDNSEPEGGCGTGKSWSPSDCACTCDNSEPEEGCGTGKSWSPSACACACDNSEPEGGCGDDKEWSPSDCECKNKEPTNPDDDCTSGVMTQACCEAKGGIYTEDETTHEADCCVEEDKETALNWLRRLIISPAYAGNLCYRGCMEGYAPNDSGKCEPTQECKSPKEWDEVAEKCICPESAKPSSCDTEKEWSTSACKCMSVSNSGGEDDCPRYHTRNEQGECIPNCKKGGHSSKIPGRNEYICCAEGSEASSSGQCCDNRGYCCDVGWGDTAANAFETIAPDDEGVCCNIIYMAENHDGRKQCCTLGNSDSSQNLFRTSYIRDEQKYSVCCPLYDHVYGANRGADYDGNCCTRGSEEEDGKTHCCANDELAISDYVHGGSKCCKEYEVVGPTGECCTPGTPGCCKEGERLFRDGCRDACTHTTDKKYFYCGVCHECPFESPNPGKEWIDCSGGEGVCYGLWDRKTCTPCPEGTTYSCEKLQCVGCPDGTEAVKGKCCESNKVATNAGIKECCDRKEVPSGESGKQICCPTEKSYVVEYTKEDGSTAQTCCTSNTEADKNGNCCTDENYHVCNGTCYAPCENGEERTEANNCECPEPDDECQETEPEGGCGGKKHWETSECTCVCDDSEPEGGCGTGKSWSPSDCACACDNSEPEEGCGTGKSWSPSTCACTCDNSEPEEGCGTGKSWSPSDCACTCDNSEPEGGCGTGKSWSPSACACACDNSEPEEGCGDNKEWNTKDCACGCKNFEPEGGCGGNKTWIDSECACMCNSSEPAGGCGDKKHWDTSECACVCDETCTGNKVHNANCDCVCPDNTQEDSEGTCCMGDKPQRAKWINKGSLYSYDRLCCPEGANYADENKNCCLSGTTIALDENGKSFCCATGVDALNGACCPEETPQRTWSYNNSGEDSYVCCAPGAEAVNGSCCPSGWEPRRSRNNNGDDTYVCCPQNVEAVDGQCCQEGTKARWINQDHWRCCAPGADVVSGECCPIDKPNKKYSWGNDVYICCPDGVDAVNGSCCPSDEPNGVESSNDNGKSVYLCCPDGVDAVNGSCCPANKPSTTSYYDSNNNEKYVCCPEFVDAINGQCCPNDKPSAVWSRDDNGYGGWGDQICCPEGVDAVNGSCCPSANPVAAQTYDEQDHRVTACCPKGSREDSDGYSDDRSVVCVPKGTIYCKGEFVSACPDAINVEFDWDACYCQYHGYDIVG